ncbi:AAA family ATPase [Escherichia albertii]|uniref:AAA family ATPase n=1 Tax=Escherichia albertii TaxID=208962 RepID=UPI000CF690DE|nr:AAA family ATPase [Escherichia albertii]
MKINHEDLIDLIKASLDANYSEVRSVSNRIVRAISAQDADLAKQIKSIIRKKGVPLRSSGYTDSLPLDPKSRMPLVEEVEWPATPLFLSDESQHIFHAFIQNVIHQNELIENGIPGKLNLLLSGPPGTGKTLVAGHIASKLNKPLYVVRLDSVISSLLGDTAKNLRQIFDFVPTKDGVLFLDEVDAVAKLRDDNQEVGELKRVVNTLIQGLDSLDDSAIVIAATNHSKLLDPAIWRRFPYKISFGLPGQDVRCAMWEHFLFRDDTDSFLSKMLSIISIGLTGADIENISLSARRHSVLSGNGLDIPSVVYAILNSVADSTAIPFGKDINSSVKKNLAKELSKFKLSQADIGRLLNVSRQTISGYFKE